MYQTAKSLEGTPYKLSGKTSEGIDCSGFVCKVAKASGYNVSGTSEQILMSANEVYSTNALRGKESLFKEGDVIAIDTGEKSFDKGRDLGIDHIGIVVENNGKLFLAESTSGKGVQIIPIEEGLARFQALSEKSGKEEAIFIGKGLPESKSNTKPVNTSTPVTSSNTTVPKTSPVEAPVQKTKSVSTQPSVTREKVEEVKNESVLNNFLSYTKNKINEVKDYVENKADEVATVLLSKGAGITKSLISEVGMENEDVDDVLEMIQNGASVDDVKEIVKNFISKKQEDQVYSIPKNSRKTSLVTKEAIKIGTKNQIVPMINDYEITPIPNAKDKGGYKASLISINLKSPKAKFEVVGNVKPGGSKANEYYKNFKPIKGTLVATIQNDSNTDKLPSFRPYDEKLKSQWSKTAESQPYVLSLSSDGQLNVKNIKELKPNENVFNLRHKLFKMDDLEIKEKSVTVDGKTKKVPYIVTERYPNIGSVAKVKDNMKSKRWSTVIGLGYGTLPKEMPIEDTNKYGRAQGGSYIIFSEDLTQQYLISGSFSTLYDFHKELKERNPNKEFQIFLSDTGAYSESVNPNNGQITSDIIRKRNLEHPGGKETNHLILRM